MDFALSIASWVVVVAVLVGFAGLGVYGLALRRAAQRDTDALGGRRVQEAGALAAVAVALALGTQLFFVPFYARTLFGQTVRASFVEVTSKGGRSPVYKLRAAYKDASGRRQPIEVQVSNQTYLRYYDMSFACQIDEIQASADRQLAKAGQPRLPRLGLPNKRCEPIDFVVVDGWPWLAQLGTEPMVGVEGVVGAVVLWGILLFGMRRQVRRAPPAAR